jgi:two-component system response regulator NreC
VCGEAEDGLDAIEKARILNPDLIVLDLSMPRMNGLTAAPRLRALLPDIPIILFTMHKGVIDAPTASQAGITAVVDKSEDVIGLVEEVQKLLNRSRSIRSTADRGGASSILSWPRQVEP